MTVRAKLPVVAAILVGTALAAILPALPAVSQQSPAVPAQGQIAQFREGSGSWNYAPSLPEGWGWMGGLIDAGGVLQQVLAATGSSGTTPFSSIFLAGDLVLCDATSDRLVVRNFNVATKVAKTDVAIDNKLETAHVHTTVAVPVIEEVTPGCLAPDFTQTTTTTVTVTATMVLDIVATGDLVTQDIHITPADGTGEIFVADGRGRPGVGSLVLSGGGLTLPDVATGPNSRVAGISSGRTTDLFVPGGIRH